MISGLTEDAIIEHSGERIGEHTGRAGAHEEFLVRKAGMHDIGPILGLINGYAAKGVMLPRTELEVSEDIRDFSVIVTAGRLMGCGALHFYTPSIGEIRSLAVAEDAKTLGIGRRLIEALVREASNYSLDAVFAFTYVAGFFGKMGFQEVERGELPLKVWKDCVRCPKFQCCDEIAVMRVLRPDYCRNVQQYLQHEDSHLVQLPVLRGLDHR
ncbi:MAG TPA: N-acetyltransferase [Bryobacteraceae bacterium]|jgi:amino-acid N-acetyltransferase|nr:N-acetyltransferase [Bryobacteraceae bacterium]